VCLGAAGAFQAQKPLSQDEALKQVYSQYDAQKKTAQWACTKAQEGTFWPCPRENERVSVSVVLMVETQEGGAKKIYLVTSAKPIDPEFEYDCHPCAPAIGVSVFAWQAQHWVLQSVNAAVGLYGALGSPPSIELVRIGPERHGLLLHVGSTGQGYTESSRILLAPLGKSVNEIWTILDEQDNLGRIDPDDKQNSEAPYKSWTTIRFFAANDGTSRDYYDANVVSRGNSSDDGVHLKPENWTEVYRFKDGEYKLLSHKDFVEVKKPAKK
jgi:hypothetical protein